MVRQPAPAAPHEPPAAAALSRRALTVAWVSLLGGLVIMALKVGVFLLTNSAAVLSDALESIINLVAAGMAVLSTWYASRPPDREHPYGHGRVEVLAAGFEGFLVGGAAVAVFIEGWRRLAGGAQLHSLMLGAILLAGIGTLVLALAIFIWRSGATLRSATLVADGKHLFADGLTTISVFVSLILVQTTGLEWIDAAVALVLAVYIGWTGLRMITGAWHGLMDRVDPEDDRRIRAILDAAINDGEIVGYHKVRHRSVGGFKWIDIHLQVTSDLTVKAAHDLASAIEHRIETTLGRANATAHIEPEELADDV